MDSDDKDFNIAEHPPSYFSPRSIFIEIGKFELDYVSHSVNNQSEQTNEIKPSENHNLQIETSENSKPSHKISPNCASGTKNERKINCKILNIVDRRGNPHFHIEIDGQIYFYGFRRVRADYKMVFQCQKSKCNNTSFISPLENLKQIIHDKPKGHKTHVKKFLDILDAKVYDTNNYDINSFEIGGGHNHPGTELDVYLKINNKPEMGAKKVNCKLLKITTRRGYPSFHFDINGKIYFYGFRGIRADYKIVFYCTICRNKSSISPSEYLKEIIQNTPNKLQSTKVAYSKFIDKSDPKVYDINNYDINSFEICGSHKCAGTELDDYIKTNNEEIARKVKCKLLKITHPREHPIFHFEIDRNVYFYEVRGIKADYEIVLHCTKTFKNGKAKCNNNASILPLESFKQIIQNTPKFAKYSKCFDNSDHRIYDIEKYDINSFEISGGHKCPGTELSVYFKNKNNRYF
jgi:hypothetical protein